ncbi:hypothetical protein BaRGS_00019249, partial [Batillaria attramentaria]
RVSELHPTKECEEILYRQKLLYCGRNQSEFSSPTPLDIDGETFAAQNTIITSKTTSASIIVVNGSLPTAIDAEKVAGKTFYASQLWPCEKRTTPFVPTTDGPSSVNQAQDRNIRATAKPRSWTVPKHHYVQSGTLITLGCQLRSHEVTVDYRSNLPHKTPNKST